MDGEIAKVPQGRLGEMEEIADSIMFLASPLSSFMCGSGLVVGMLIDNCCLCDASYWSRESFANMNA